MIIYEIKNKLNDKKYIGQTTVDLKKRWTIHCRKLSGCLALKAAIVKYGKDNFEIKEIHKCNSLEELNEKEEYYINVLNTLSPNGYNLIHGGKNRLFSEETKNKMRGQKRSSKTRKKMSLARMGKAPPNKKWTLNTLIVEASKYSTRSEFCRSSSGAYSAAWELNILDLVCHHMPRYSKIGKKPSNKKWTVETLAREALKYSTRNDFCKNSGSAYVTAKNLGVFEKICTHMKRPIRK